MPILPIPSTLDVIIFAVPVCILWLSQLKAMDAKIRAHGPLANSKFSYYVYSLHSMAATAQPAFPANPASTSHTLALDVERGSFQRIRLCLVIQRPILPSSAITSDGCLFTTGT